LVLKIVSLLTIIEKNSLKTMANKTGKRGRGNLGNNNKKEVDVENNLDGVSTEAGIREKNNQGFHRRATKWRVQWKKTGRGSRRIHRDKEYIIQKRGNLTKTRESKQDHK